MALDQHLEIMDEQTPASSNEETIVGVSLARAAKIFDALAMLKENYISQGEICSFIEINEARMVEIAITHFDEAECKFPVDKITREIQGSKFWDAAAEKFLSDFASSLKKVNEALSPPKPTGSLHNSQGAVEPEITTMETAAVSVGGNESAPKSKFDKTSIALVGTAGVAAIAIAIAALVKGNAQPPEAADSSHKTVTVPSVAMTALPPTAKPEPLPPPMPTMTSTASATPSATATAPAVSTKKWNKQAPTPKAPPAEPKKVDRDLGY